MINHLILQYIKRDKVVVAAVPQIEGLTVEDMLESSKGKAAVLRHLPDERDWDHMDRKWLADVLNTTDRAKFERMVKAAVNARRERLEDKNNLNVSIRPEFAQAFQSCMNFSSKLITSTDDIFSRKRVGLALDEVLV